ncbi:hypothetical protein FACS189418_2760 [Clostridia bacterium]|nr:hypothetical protein FACS189418_2760 [Clostridia bacterium]
MLKQKQIAFCLCFITYFCFWKLTGYACIFLYLTGFSCPGCGMSRAWLFALRGNIHQAFFYHPLFWTVPVYAGLAFGKKQQIQYKERKARHPNEIFYLLGIAAFFIVYFYRMANSSVLQKNIQNGLFYYFVSKGIEVYQVSFGIH